MTRQTKLLVTLGALIALYLLARTDKGAAIVTDVLSSGARGIRNNNPGNIRKSTTTVWQGQVPPDQQLDPDFVTFSAPEFGIRAMAKTLRTYFSLGFNTIERIISRWAPAKDKNNTAAYIAAVANETGLSPSAELTTLDIVRLIPAIIRHENGSQPYPRSLIEKGISLS